MSISGESPAPRPVGPAEPGDAENALDRSTEREPGDEPETRLESTEPYTSSVRRPDLQSVLFYIHLDPAGRPGSLGRLAHYEIFNVIGRGAMGVVLRAFDTVLSRTVAIKVMSLQLMSSAQARERFFREARAAAGINHPNVVTIHAVSEHAGIPFLVMECVGGGSLMDRIRKAAPLDPIDVLRISAQVASGLAAAHQQGVIHRDIKPANIMLEDSIERVKITDFGLARVVMEQSDLTSQGGVVGTPAYMSPEQVNGQPLDPRSDLFSLGCVMYAMIAGHSPFRGENALGTARRVAGQMHVSLGEISREVPPYFIQVVDRLLEKNPDDRYQTAAEVVAELTGYLAKLNSGGVPEVEALPRKSVWQAGATRLVLGLAVVAAAVALWVAAGGITPWPKGSPLPDRGRALTVPGQGGILRVAHRAGADCASIAEALRRATPGSTIRVEDSTVYDEPLVFTDSAKLAGVRLEAPAGATLIASGQRPVLLIDGVPGISVSGFRIEAAAGQHALEVRGDCPGVIVEDCQITSASDSSVAAVYLHAGASGTSGAPILLRRLSVKCGGVGIVFGGRGEPEALRYVELEESRVHAASRDYGAAVVVQAGAEHVIIRRNVLTTGLMGVSFAFEAPNRATDLVIAWNSLGGLQHAFVFGESPAEQEGVRIAHNLIVGCDAVYAGAREMEPFTHWFRDNWWERGSGLDEPLASRFAEPKDPLSFVSRDPESADYLKPAGEPATSAPGRYSPPSPRTAADEPD
ncbi:MAG: serine/threonine-protein kinase [Isosphaeraceae bacterium]|nr:serine/threonine-protein kinase [Isosphaeraceae bacterium]